MGIEAKTELMNEMNKRLGDILTMNDTNNVMSILSDVLAEFVIDNANRTKDESDDLLDAYTNALEVQGRSQKTIARYTYVLGRMKEVINIPTAKITVYHLRKFLSDEKKRGIADATLESVRQVMSAYFGWLWREGLIAKNPVENLGAIKCPKKIKEVYSDVEMEKLRRACRKPYERAVLHFLASTGCRISEMCGLNRDDVDMNALECVVCGKGDKERTVYMNPVAGLAIKEYLASRKDDNEALFVGRTSARVRPDCVRQMLKELAKRAGVAHVHPHKFRRTLATTMIHHGMTIQEVAAILGHDKLDTTMKYVVMDKTQVSNAYRKFA